MRRVVPGLVALLVLVVLLVWYAPARLLPWTLQQAGIDSQWYGVQGRLWSGQAAAIQLTWEGQRFDLGSLQWSLQPAWLLLGELRGEWRLHGAQHRLSGAVIAQAGQVSLSQVSGSVPTQWASLWLPVAVSGPLGLELASVELGPEGWPRQIQGSLGWQQAHWFDGHQHHALGSFGGRLESDASGALQLQIDDLGDGPLELTLQAQLSADGHYRLQGEAAARQTLAEGVQQFLEFWGKPQSGRYQLAFDGRW